MKTQYDGFASDSLKDLSKYVSFNTYLYHLGLYYYCSIQLSVSYSIAFLTSLNQFASSMNIPHKHDPRRYSSLYS